MNDRTKLLLVIPLLALLALLALLFITFAGTSMASATCTPPGSGNWDINNGESCSPAGPTVTVSGDLTINNGGSLTLSGVALKMDATSVGERTITVKAGGTLNVVSTSSVSSTNSIYQYKFIIEKGATATITDSSVRDCGFDSTPDTEMGLYIASDTVTISRSTFTNDMAGLYIKDASPKIDNSTFSSDQFGIFVKGSLAKPKVYDSHMNSNIEGLRADGSSPIFTNNEMAHNGDMGAFLIDSSAMLSGNYIHNNTFFGVYIQSGSPTLKNNFINNNLDGLRAYYSDPQILGNQFINDTRYTLYLYRTGGMVEDNRLQSSVNPYLNSLSYGIYMCTATTTIKGNSIELMKQTSIGVLSGSNALIQDNVITYYEGRGIRVASSTIRIEGNIIHYNMTPDAVALSISGSSGTIKDNTFQHNSYGLDATYINQSSVIEGNTFKECSKVAMKLFEASIVVKDNTFESNYLGLDITSSKPQVLNNTFTDNRNGLHINFFTDAYISGNHFMLGNFSINVTQGMATLVNNSLRFSNNYSVFVSLESHVHMINNLIDGKDQKGVYFHNSQGFLENNTFSNTATGFMCYGSEIYLEYNNFTHDSLGIAIFNSKLVMEGDIFSNNTFQAIMTDSSDTTFNDITLYDNKAGLQSFASHLYITNMTLINNEIGLFVWEDLSAHIDGLYISGSNEASVQVWKNDPNLLSVYFDDIKIYNNNGKFQIQESTVVISTSTFMRGKAGIELTNGTLRVLDSTFIDMNATAITGQLGNIWVERSLFMNNTMGLHADTSNLTILESRIERNNESGIQVRSTDLVLRDTRIVMNKDGIIELGKSSFDILDCNISSNTVFGLFTSGTSKFVKVNFTRKMINEDNQFLIHGQITVSEGAQLYLLRANLQFWSDTPGASGLVVMRGGQLFMRENVVSAYDPALGYYMRADQGSLIEMSNVTIRHCGKGMSGTGRGLEVRTDKADLRDIYFEDNAVGLFVVGTTVQAQGLRFNMNQIGLDVMDGEAYIISSTFNASADKDIVLTRSTARMLDCKFTYTKADVQDQGSILIVMWYLKVTVVWNDGQPVGGASVSVIDKGNAILQSTTDAQGNTPSMIVKEYQQKGPEPSGYTGLSPHDVRVKYNGITVDKDQYIGASMTLTVPLKDDKPPIIIVTTPSSGEIMYTSNVLFIGTAVDEGSSVVLIELSLDGKNWFAANGTDFWSGFMTVPDGAHVVQIRGTDSRGNHIIISVAVEVDLTSPLLQILSPRDGTITNASFVKVYGIVHQGAKLLINGEQVHVDANGTFSYIFDLFEGPNKLSAKAFGKNNETMQANLVIIRDTVAPLISLLNPKAGAMVNSTTITVTVSSNEEVSFFVNGRPVSTFGGKADTTVELIEGPNAIMVKAVDLAGNPTIYSFNVTLDTTMPSLILEKPLVTVFRTTNGALLIKGVTEKGANLTLNGKAVPVAADGSFSYKMKLRVGKNDFALTSKDQAGNANTISLAVTRKLVTYYTPYYMLLGLLVGIGVVADVGVYFYFQRYYRPKGPATKDQEGPTLEDYPRRPEPPKPAQDQRRNPRMPPPPKGQGPAKAEFDEVNDLEEF